MGFKVAVFTLNQWALDFTGNTRRIKESISIAQQHNVHYRAGPELEVCGYSLEDAFYESDTVYHSWQALVDILEHSKSLNMIVDIGMPIRYDSCLYNCRVICHLGKILCIRAKTRLANAGNYREMRHFTPWDLSRGTVNYRLPEFVRGATGQDSILFGADFKLSIEYNSNESIKVGWEICQELWESKNVSASLYEDHGCHVVFNGSASYWELRKLENVMDIMKGISLRGLGVYAFANLIGCDGQRYVFYGRSCIYDRGQLVAMNDTKKCLLHEVSMVSYTVDPREIEEQRSQQNFGRCVASSLNDTSRVVRIAMPSISGSCSVAMNTVVTNETLRFEEEIRLYTSLWLWDYLRRSGMKGFMVPLSGGLDSSSVIVIVFCMCRLLCDNLQNDSISHYLTSAHAMTQSAIDSSKPTDLCKRLLSCAYLSTQYSGQATCNRAKDLSRAVNAKFTDLSIQNIYDTFRSSLGAERGPEGKVTLLEQNLQARIRMTATYFLSEGNRIVLATGNVDEAIMGYLTKYDCSSADINPIGGLCKEDLRSFLVYCRDEFKHDFRSLIPVIDDLLDAPPSAELTGAEQRDEDEIGLTYAEISILGKVRRGKWGAAGPRSAFLTVWNHRNERPYCDHIRVLKHVKSSDNQSIPDAVVAERLAELIKKFYNRYARNRHKLTVLTPALHTETYSPDDNRYDHRHFLYAPWTEQFRILDVFVDQIKNGQPLSEVDSIRR